MGGDRPRLACDRVDDDEAAAEEGRRDRSFAGEQRGLSPRSRPSLRRRLWGACVSTRSPPSPHRSAGSPPPPATRTRPLASNATELAPHAYASSASAGRRERKLLQQSTRRPVPDPAGACGPAVGCSPSPWPPSGRTGQMATPFVTSVSCSPLLGRMSRSWPSASVVRWAPAAAPQQLPPIGRESHRVADAPASRSADDRSRSRDRAARGARRRRHRKGGLASPR